MTKIIRRTLAFAAITLIVAFIAVYFLLDASLATLNGEKKVSGISEQVSITRDAQGIPTIQANSRHDTAFALGFLHAQERFFQMDLLRKSAAGELNEIVGSVVEKLDMKKRVHRFRARAEKAYQALPADQQALLQAYANGVNSGLTELSAKPFEYYLLNKDPSPWLPEESFLAVYAMYMDLQHEMGLYERSIAIMQEQLPADWFEFLRPQAVANAEQSWESPIAGTHQHSLSIPSTPWQSVVKMDSPKLAYTQPTKIDPSEDVVVGSNNWGVSGQLSPYQSGIVAVDMHLGIRVPNIWYRASWYLSEDGRRVTGASLPGAPLMIVGSNEHISWGFTNSYGDWSDVIKLTLSENGKQYKTPQGWRDFTVYKEQVGQQSLEVKETIWGPVIGTDQHGDYLALRWVAHDVEGANLQLMALEQASTVAEAITIAAGTGMPAQNLMVTDKAGDLAWALIGAIPNRPPLASQYINDWSEDDSQNWQNYLNPTSYPSVSTEQYQRLWTANSRVVADARYNTIGDGGYDIGIRASAIKKRLFEKEQFDEQALLDIQLDTRNLVLDRWHKFLVDYVSALPDNTSMHEAMVDYLADYDGHARLDSLSYVIVRNFRQEIIKLTLGPVYKMLEEQSQQVESPMFGGDEKRFVYSAVDNHLENPVWLLINEQPKHLLNSEFNSWKSLIAQALTNTYFKLKKADKPIEEVTWADFSVAKIQHPLSLAVPILSPLLDMPEQSLPGDRKHVARIQGTTHGASERMVVSPGNEANGIFHMATGQSGHPLSPFYAAGHQDWVEGKPSPFLPGNSVYHLTLKP